MDSASNNDLEVPAMLVPELIQDSGGLLECDEETRVD